MTNIISDNYLFSSENLKTADEGQPFDLSQWWGTLSPDTRNALIGGGIGAGVGGLGSMFMGGNPLYGMLGGAGIGALGGYGYNSLFGGQQPPPPPAATTEEAAAPAPAPENDNYVPPKAAPGVNFGQNGSTLEQDARNYAQYLPYHLTGRTQPVQYQTGNDEYSTRGTLTPGLGGFSAFGPGQLAGAWGKQNKNVQGNTGQQPVNNPFKFESPFR